jgi:hypothetical protein
VLLGLPDPVVVASAEPTRVTGSPGLSARMTRLLAGHDVESFFAAQPALEQTAVPLHPSRRARRLELPDGGPSLVAVVWPASSLPDRNRCLHAVRDLAERADHAAVPGEDYRFRVQDEAALVWPAGGGDPWAVAENLGTTLEDELRFGGLAANDRRRLVSALGRFRRAMVDTGAVWQGFAPRNMFRRGDQIVLIDFEELADAKEEPVRAAEKLAWHRVFFSDCLQPYEADRLFVHDLAATGVHDDEKLRADKFEQALLGVETVTWRQRRGLLARSTTLEGRHRRPGSERDGGWLFGHELGHFWGDFLPPTVEVRIFQALSARLPDRVRAACLEAFEAAMESDIVRMLRQSAESEPDLTCPRTVALADAVSTTGVWPAARARLAVPAWYEWLERDPAKLTDELVLALGQSVPGVGPGDRVRFQGGRPPTT